LIDRDVVEPHNANNQFYGPHQAGESKVDAIADRLEQLNPSLQVERRIADLEDVPWEDFADVQIVLAGLDSLAARQVVAEKCWATETPYLDGGVGNPLDSQVQVVLPGKACLECGWGAKEYQQRATEYPCRPGAPTQAPATTALGATGAATAAMMVAQTLNLLGEFPPPQSYQVHGDLLAGRVISTWRRRNERCRFHHQPAPQLIHLRKAFADATIADLLAAASDTFAGQSLQFQFRRGLLQGDLFPANQLASIDQLQPIKHHRLAQFGLTVRDRVAIRTATRAQAAHVCFHSNDRSLP
jgi:hypothetical protein